MAQYQDMFKMDRTEIYKRFDLTDWGFLTMEPISKLGNDFKEWEDLMDRLPELNEKKQTRSEIMKLPDFSWQNLKDPWQWKRAYVILTLLINSYVWSEPPQENLPRENLPVQTIPKKIAVPAVKVSEHLGITPILTHAAVDLYNWDYIDPDKPFSLDNLKSVSLMTTATKSESWFYLVMVAIEQVGGHIIKCILDADQSIQYNSPSSLLKNLKEMKVHMIETCNIMKRMYAGCEPKDFWFKLRPYLSGWTKAELFPDGGMVYEGVNDNKPLKYHGGSAAQSSLLAVIDAATGITHKDGYFDMIRDYMPKAHREFILYVKGNINIIDYVKYVNSDDLNEAYDGVIKTMEKFRDIHYGLVRRYIIKMLYDELKENDPTFKMTLRQLESTIEGSGGTLLQEFLQGALRNTKDTMLDKARKFKTLLSKEGLLK